MKVNTVLPPAVGSWRQTDSVGAPHKAVSLDGGLCVRRFLSIKIYKGSAFCRLATEP